MRGSGILLHITSLPSPFGMGDMGPGAYRFADFLEEAGQSLWQILPLNPTAYSPYHSSSSFASNPYLISPEVLVTDGLLDEADLGDTPDLPKELVDFLMQKPRGTRGSMTRHDLRGYLRWYGMKHVTIRRAFSFSERLQ